MKSYFVIQISRKGETVEPAIYSYETSNDAVKAFHSRMSASMVDTNDEALVMAVNWYGAVIRSEHYQKEEPTPVDPEVTP